MSENDGDEPRFRPLLRPRPMPLHHLLSLEVSGSFTFYRSRLGLRDGVRPLLLANAREHEPEGVTLGW